MITSIYLPSSSKPYQPEVDFIENKTLSRPFNVMPRIVACNSITQSTSLYFWTVEWKFKYHRKNIRGIFWEYFHQIFMKYKYSQGG